MVRLLYVCEEHGRQSLVVVMDGQKAVSCHGTCTSNALNLSPHRCD